MTTLWSKFIPGCTAEVIGSPDDAGRLPAYITNGGHPEFTRVAASLDPNEWSDVEIVPAPESIPEVVYGVISGHASAPTVDIVFTEREAIHALTIPGVMGYVPVYVARNQMIPRQTVSD